MRERGLKRFSTRTHRSPQLVAPHAGAWIETHYQYFSLRQYRVAPHAGAWIETQVNGVLAQTDTVAPHAGAWIETWGMWPFAR